MGPAVAADSLTMAMPRSCHRWDTLQRRNVHHKRVSSVLAVAAIVAVMAAAAELPCFVPILAKPERGGETIVEAHVQTVASQPQPVAKVLPLLMAASFPAPSALAVSPEATADTTPGLSI